MGKKNKKNSSQTKFFNQPAKNGLNAKTNAKVDPQKMDEAIKRMYQFKEEGKYEDALVAVIDLFNMGCIKTDIIFEPADIYYLIGDYDRAIVWGKKTLTFDKNHIKAILLLGNIYAIQNKVSDCLEMIEKALKACKGAPTDEVRETADELLDYLESDYDEASVRERYPAIRRFLDDKNDGYSNQSDLCDLPDTQEPSVEVAAAETIADNDEIEETIEPDDAREADVREDEAAGDLSESGAEIDLAESMAEPDEEEEASQEPEGSIEQAIDALMMQPVSLREKIDQCNSLACDYYDRGEFESVVRLLKQALEIDRHDDLTLRNWIFMLAQLGENKTALNCLADMDCKDLALLSLARKIKGN